MNKNMFLNVVNTCIPNITCWLSLDWLSVPTWSLKSRLDLEAQTSSRPPAVCLLLVWLLADCFTLVSSFLRRLCSFPWVSLVQSFGAPSSQRTERRLETNVKVKDVLRAYLASQSPVRLIFRSRYLPQPPLPSPPPPPPAGFQLSDRLFGDRVERPESSHLLAFSCRAAASDSSRRLETERAPSGTGCWHLSHDILTPVISKTLR